MGLEELNKNLHLLNLSDANSSIGLCTSYLQGVIRPMISTFVSAFADTYRIFVSVKTFQFGQYLYSRADL